MVESVDTLISKINDLKIMQVQFLLLSNFIYCGWKKVRSTKSHFVFFDFVKDFFAVINFFDGL